MSKGAKKVVFISASPKANEKSVSEMLGALGEDQMKSDSIQVNQVNVRQSIIEGKTEQAFETLRNADALIFIFPLYFFCLPGILMRFLQDYCHYCANRMDRVQSARVYAVVNCGFPEPEINGEAVRVIQSFSEKMGYSFRFGVQIGGGGMLLGTKDAHFMRKTMEKLNGAFLLMKDDLLGGGQGIRGNISVSIKFPRKLYFFMGNTGWGSLARKNGLRKRDLYRKPYRE